MHFSQSWMTRSWSLHHPIPAWLGSSSVVHCLPTVKLRCLLNGSRRNEAFHVFTYFFFFSGILSFLSTLLLLIVFLARLHHSCSSSQAETSAMDIDITFLIFTALTNICTVAPVFNKTLILHLTILILSYDFYTPHPTVPTFSPSFSSGSVPFSLSKCLIGLDVAVLPELPIQTTQPHAAWSSLATIPVGVPILRLLFTPPHKCF